MWRSLAVYYRGDKKQHNKFATREALNLARFYYENPKLKREDVRAPKLVDMEGISRKFNINIRIFEPKTNSEKALFLVTIITGYIGKTASTWVCWAVTGVDSFISRVWMF